MATREKPPEGRRGRKRRAAHEAEDMVAETIVANPPSSEELSHKFLEDLAFIHDVGIDL